MKGFTLVEILIVIVVLVLVVGVIYAGYVLSQRAYREGEASAELVQNARVILERMTREIRQTREIVTELPVVMEEAFSYIEFEDGHSAERYHYIRYFQEDSELKREVKAYYFVGAEETFVPWNALPPPGGSIAEVVIEEAKTIGEFVTDLKLWAPEIRKVDIFITLEKGEKQTNLSTSIFGRNL